jgi:membrane associated rhomboid family serine protease
MFARLPPATLVFILANIGVYLLQLAGGPAVTQTFELWPLASPLFEPWQLFTYAFLHSPESFAHIFFNMFALFMFGPQLELLWGSARFIAFYFICVLCAALAQIAVTSATGSLYSTLGASGAIFGLLLAFALFFPRQRVAIYGVIPMPAWLFVALYGIAELFFGVTNLEPGVAHFAHLGGMLGAALVILYWRLKGAAGRRRF